MMSQKKRQRVFVRISAIVHFPKKIKYAECVLNAVLNNRSMYLKTDFTLYSHILSNTYEEMIPCNEGRITSTKGFTVIRYGVTRIPYIYINLASRAIWSIFH